MADVVDAVLEHGDALRPHAEGEAGVDVRVVAGGAQHVGVHHARAEDLQPVAAPLDGHVDAGLDEREVVAAEADARLRAEHPAGELEERVLEVGERDAPVHGEPLDLVELGLVGGVGRLVAVALAGDDDADGGLVRLHDARLHRRGVGAQERREAAVRVAVRVEPEGVEHVAGGVVLRDVQHLEVVAVPLDLRPLGDLEAHVPEDGLDLAHDDGGGVVAPVGGGPARERDVDGVGAEPIRERGLNRIAAFLEPLFEDILRLVGGGPGGAALLLRELRDAPQHLRHPAGAAQVLDAPRFERVGGTGAFESVEGRVAHSGGVLGGCVSHGASVYTGRPHPNPLP